MKESESKLICEEINNLVLAKGAKAVSFFIENFNKLVNSEVYGRLKPDCYNPNKHLEEVVSDVWTDMMEYFNKCYNAHQQAIDKNPISWLKKVASSRSIKHLIEEKKRSTLSLDDEDSEGKILYLANKHNNFDIYRDIKERSPEKRLLDIENRKFVRESILEFSPAYQEVITLYLNGHTNKEISKILGIKANNVSKIVGRVINKIRQKNIGTEGGF